MQYKSKSKSFSGFVVNSITEDFNYLQDKDKKLGTTPVGILNAALSGCIGMCVRGYLWKVMDLNDTYIEIDSDLDSETFIFNIKVKVDAELTKENIKGIIANIESKCTVSKMLGPNVTKIIEIEGK